MIFLLVLIALEIGLVIYFLYYSLMRPEIEKKRQLWQKVVDNFENLEKAPVVRKEFDGL